MPLPYILLHLVLCLIGVFATLRLGRNPRATLPWGIFVLILVILGLAIERSPVWSWSAMGWGITSLVFLTNQTLFGVAVLITLMWTTANDRAARRRALALGIPLTAVALWSYSWLFMPLPPGLSGKADKTGYCAQTTDDSCSAAAAVMLLQQYDVRTTEREMAQLCLTRYHQGTPPLGLYRGVALKASVRYLKPKSFQVRDLKSMRAPCIIAVGLKKNVPHDIAVKMDSYGWQPGVRHAVAILKAEPNGQWFDVADPTFGRERWPTQDLQYIWDGRLLMLVPQ